MYQCRVKFLELTGATSNATLSVYGKNTEIFYLGLQFATISEILFLLETISSLAGMLLRGISRNIRNLG